MADDPKITIDQVKHVAKLAPRTLEALSTLRFRAGGSSLPLRGSPMAGAAARFRGPGSLAAAGPEAIDCKWGARGINADVLHQLDDARSHARDEDETLGATLVVFDAEA